MRWGRGVLVVLLAVLVPARANAQCPGSDGTLPGSPAEVYTIGTGDTAIYVDDRDFFDADDDGDAGGTWIYMESNGEPGLQRGGPHVGEALPLPPIDPTLGPIPVLPPDPNRPVFPHGVTLFPYGVGGCGYSADGSCSLYPSWPQDDCVEGDGPRDTIVF